MFWLTKLYGLTWKIFRFSLRKSACLRFLLSFCRRTVAYKKILLLNFITLFSCFMLDVCDRTGTILSWNLARLKLSLTNQGRKDFRCHRKAKSGNGRSASCHGYGFATTSYHVGRTFGLRSPDLLRRRRQAGGDQYRSQWANFKGGRTTSTANFLHLFPSWRTSPATPRH